MQRNVTNIVLKGRGLSTDHEMTTKESVRQASDLSAMDKRLGAVKTSAKHDKNDGQTSKATSRSRVSKSRHSAVIGKTASKTKDGKGNGHKRPTSAMVSSGSKRRGSVWPAKTTQGGSAALSAHRRQSIFVPEGWDLKRDTIIAGERRDLAAQLRALDPLGGVGIGENASRLLDSQLKNFFFQFQTVPTVNEADVHAHFTSLRSGLSASEPGPGAENRLKALRLLRSLAASGLTTERPFLRLLRGTAPGIAHCLDNYHSQTQLITETCITLGYLAEKLSRKNFQTSVAVIFSHVLSILPTHSIGFVAHICATLIVQQVRSSLLIPAISEALESKSPIIKSACCELMTMMIETWPSMVIVRNISALMAAVKRATHDADDRTRSTARLTCLALIKRFPNVASSVRDTMQRAQRSLMAQEIRTLRQTHLEGDELLSMTSFARTVPRFVPLPIASIRSKMEAAAAEAAVEAAHARFEAPVTVPDVLPRLDLMTLGDPPAFMGVKKKNVISYRIPAYHSQSLPSISSRRRHGAKRTSSSDKDSLKVESKKRARKAVKPRIKKTPTERSKLSQQEVQEETAPLIETLVAWRPRAVSTVSELAVGHTEKDVLVYQMVQDEISGECMAVRQMSKDVEEIFDQLTSDKWETRRDGLMMLHDELYRNLLLEKDDLKKLCAIIIRLLHDPYMTVTVQLLSVTVELLRGHRGELARWVPVILPALLDKLAGVQAGGAQHGLVKRALRVIRRTYPKQHQVHALCLHMASPTLTLSTKERLTLMTYFLGLINRMGSLDSVNLTTLSQGIATISEWTDEASSQHVRQMARDILFALNLMDRNKLWIAILQQPQLIRDKCRLLLESEPVEPDLKVHFGGDMKEPETSASVSVARTGPRPPGIRVLDSQAVVKESMDVTSVVIAKHIAKHKRRESWFSRASLALGEIKLTTVGEVKTPPVDVKTITVAKQVASRRVSQLKNKYPPLTDDDAGSNPTDDSDMKAKVEQPPKKSPPSKLRKQRKASQRQHRVGAKKTRK